MKLNNIEVPAVNNRGRLFPYKSTGPHYAGPIVLDGKVKVIKLWENKSFEGRTYFRAVIEEVEVSQFTLTDI